MEKIKHVLSLRKVAWVILVIGGINRGLIGLFRFNVIEKIFGDGFFSHLLYVLVGLATVYLLTTSDKKKISPLRK